MSKAKTRKKLGNSVVPKKKTEKIKEFFSYNRYVILAFLIPFALMSVAFGLMNVSPFGLIETLVQNIVGIFDKSAIKSSSLFGDKQILVTDLWHQYYPFLVDFQEKLQNGESLFWTWAQGGGTNYFSLMSYYLASPLNFLSVFVPAEFLREFLAVSVAVKIACAGMFTSIFLRSVFKKNDFSIAVFGCCFSFCAFFMGYYWNTIWLDTVCLTPLVVLGAVKLFSENKFRLYTITLALSLLANYYIGLFTCIFILLVFIAYNIIKWNGFKNFFVKLLQTGVFSLLAILITAFFLLPAFFGLQNTYASGSKFPMQFAINIGDTNDLLGVLDALKQILSNFLTFIEPATKEADSLPNIACGTVSLVLGIVFFTSKKISIREKIVDCVLILFMLVSCVIRQLDYIWHGFHFTNMIPYRFAYLVSFVLVVMAFRAFLLIDFSTCWDVLLASLFVTLFILLAIDIQTTYAIVGTAIVSALFCTMLFLYTKRIIPKQVLLIIISIIIIGESGATAYIGVKTTTVTSTTDYPRGTQATAQVIEYMDSLERNTPELWRAEMTTTQTLNDGALNHYNGVSMFNSMANVNMTRLASNFGMKGWKSGNRYSYLDSSPVTNMFMNLKYLITRNGEYGNDYDLTKVYNVGNKELLKNQHYIPMGFMVNENLKYWVENDNDGRFNPFDKQSEFFRLATGIDDNVYIPLQVVTQGHTDYKSFPVNKLSYGNYSFTCKDSTIEPELKWNFEATQDGLCMFYAKISGGEDVTISINGEKKHKFDMERPYIASVGRVKKGDKITLYSKLEKNQSGSANVYVNLLNEPVFEQAFVNLSDEVMTTTNLTESSMQGDIFVKNKGLFYTSVPYEEGWTAIVDGEEVEITPVGGSLVAFELTEGEHHIELKFYPKGFGIGSLVTFIGLAIFVLLCVYIYVFQKKKAGKLYVWVTETKEIPDNAFDFENMELEEINAVDGIYGENTNAENSENAENSDYSNQEKADLNGDLKLQTDEKVLSVGEHSKDFEYGDEDLSQRMAEVDRLIKEIGEENE